MKLKRLFGNKQQVIIHITPHVVPDNTKLIIMRLEDRMNGEIFSAIRDEIVKFQENFHLPVPIIVADPSMVIESLSDAELERMGLMRIPAKKDFSDIPPPPAPPPCHGVKGDRVIPERPREVPAPPISYPKA